MIKIISIFLLSLFLLFTINTKAQNGIEWSKCFESQSGIGNPRNACKTPDGGYIMVGLTNNADSTFWSNHMGYRDFGVIRIDSVGNIIWKRTYGGDGYDGAYCVIKGIRNDRYYIAGSSDSESSTNLHSPSSNYGDAWLIAIDDAGNMQWERCYGGYQQEVFNSLIQLGDSNQIYGIGSTGSQHDGDVTGNYFGTGTTGWICKINANTGMLLQQKCYGGTNMDNLYNSTKINNNSFLVQGHTLSIDHDVWVHYGNGSNNNGWLLNIDSALNIVWQKTIGSSGGGWINDVVKTQDGGFAVLGQTQNKQGDTSCFNFYVDTLVLGYGKSEAFIIKYDSLGNELWQQHYEAPLDPIQLEGRFVQMQDKGFVFSTTVNKWNGFALWPYNYGSVLFRTDSSGNLISTSRYSDGNMGNLNTKNLFTTSDNKLVVVSGHSPACSNYLSTWSVFQIGHQLSIKDKEEIESFITVYPNPSTGVFNIEFENTTKINHIIIYNSIGKVVKYVSLNKILKNYKLNLTGNAKGLYFVGIGTDQNVVFKRIILE